MWLGSERKTVFSVRSEQQRQDDLDQICVWF